MEMQVKAAAAEIKNSQSNLLPMEKVQYFVDSLKPLERVSKLFRQADDVLDK